MSTFMQSCTNGIHKELKSFENEQRFEINAKGENPYGWDITLKGNLKGQVILYFKEAEDYTVDSLLLTGNINLHKKGDWFRSELILEIKPLTQTKGNLLIDCDLYSF